MDINESASFDITESFLKFGASSAVMEGHDERPSKIRRIHASRDDDGELRNADIQLNGQDHGIGEPFNPDRHSSDGENYDDNPNRMEKESDSNKVKTLDSRESQPLMSKNQLKKIRKKEQWERGKEGRRTKRKDKAQEKKARIAEERAKFAEIKSGNEGSPSLGLSGAVIAPSRPERKRATQVPITLVMDCDFDELMNEREIVSLSAQLAWCYSENRKSPFKTHLVISSFRGQLRERMETVLANHHHGWNGVKFLDEDFEAAGEKADEIMKGPKGGTLAGALANIETKNETATTEPNTKESGQYQDLNQSNLDNGGLNQNLDSSTQSVLTSPPAIVYLSSDSDNTLDVLSPYTTYIIGGLVDKNRHKGLCHKRASERGIPTAKLPIGEFMTMQSRTVLATNHVVSIMLNWLNDGDWAKAFLKVIPKRKEAKVRNQGKEGEQVSVLHNDDDFQEDDEDTGSAIAGETV